MTKRPGHVVRPAASGRPGDDSRGRVVVVSADVGAGHDAAAAELARRLHAQGFQADRVNFFDVLPWPLPWAVKEVYRGLLRWRPQSYETLFTLTSRSSRSVNLIRALLRPALSRMRRRIPPDTQVVVTTYPFANQLLGPLRVRQRLSVPVITYVTDLAVHPTWVAPGVDTYCVLHEAGVAQARAGGADHIRLVRPLVADRFTAASELSKQQARRRFGLPTDCRLVLIVAGAWGVGDVEVTVAEVGATGCAQTVVVCGRNESLYQRLRRRPGHIFGWVDDMSALMRAVDVVVENAGGLTCQEALASGLPVVTYRPIAGHGRANAAIMARSRLTRWVLSTEQLKPTLNALMDGDPGARLVTAPVGRESARPDPAGLVARAATGAVAGTGWRPGPVSLVADLVNDMIAVVAGLFHAYDAAHSRATGRRRSR